MKPFSYSGSELELFARAVQWKRYWRGHIGPFVRGSVLEVGAGNGNNTSFLQDLHYSSWVCVEPDQHLSTQLRARIRPGPRTTIVTGTLADLPESCTFDTILYLDALEHVQDDASELTAAARRLLGKAHLVVLAPAHPWLYSPFDRGVGHVRRYGRRSLCAAMPKDLSLVRLRYLDSAGLLALLGNRLLLKHALPTERQLNFWDKHLVAVSRLVDPLTGYRLGKSILGVWQKPG